MTTNIYILKLEDGKYYVGKSDNPMKRYQEHLNGSGSSWTRKYKPIGIEKVISNQTDFDEDKYVKIYMNKFGIENVRGGAYVLEELPDYQIETLRNEIWGSTNKCTQCGRSGHFVKDCYAKTNVDGDELLSESESESEEEIIICEDCNKEFDSDYAFNKHTCRPSKKSSGTCYRCGRLGHYSTNCYARTHKNGYYLD